MRKQKTQPDLTRADSWRLLSKTLTGRIQWLVHVHSLLEGKDGSALFGKFINIIQEIHKYTVPSDHRFKKNHTP